MMRRLVPAALMAAALAACAPRDAHVPDFARKQFEPFSRSAAVEIALREWRLFGEVIVSPEASTDMSVPSDSLERRQGLWQRVGEYWWLGLNGGQTGHAYTGLHDAEGRRYPPERDGSYAWSAAFVSYAVRMAGAGSRFPYAAAHSVYVDAAVRGSAILRAEDPALYAPQPGDLVCIGRVAAGPLRYADLPVERFAGHCDIAVRREGEALAVVGGNVQDAVALKYLPLGPDGRLIAVGERPWLAVLRIQYDAP